VGYVKSLRLFPLVVAVAMGLWAQSLDQPLTNTQLETMVVNGLPDSTILLKIQIAVESGMADLDDSGTALAVLKAKGASERVLNAVVWAAPFRYVWMEREAEALLEKQQEETVPGLPQAVGVYFKTGSGWAQLPSFVFWTPLYSGWAWMGGKHQYSIPLDDHPRGVKVSGTKPTFYVRQARAGQEWQIGRVTSYKDERVLRMVSEPGMHQVKGISANQMQPVTLTPVTGDIFTLHVASSLAPGEYVLCTGVPGGPGLDVCYNFSVGQ